ncbi:glycosyltransferase family 2 protein [Olivibacter sp. LS-1]|uniref:glycosyltransferase n=1 Tax=Olivibacter sp. LS-1 TaxID=2592345 RepID=UPI0011EA8C98|nr:glycosyltransferase [Olivibacter sp. LS-1]QEL02926.1 glycosyltransferase family 2 protein [Olivibacter sp. LS-1]
MIALKIIWWLVQCVILFNLLMPIIFYCFYKLISRKMPPPVPATEADYAIIVTAYEDVSMLPAVVQSLLALDYQRYTIYVVADKCDTSSLQFDSDQVVLLQPEVVLAGNVRSHFYAIERFQRSHDRLTIIDSDNLVHKDYLKALDEYFALGFDSVQGVRMPKNTNTMYASLDAARDLYYHFYDGKVLFSLGSSATLAGSGMAFKVNLYREIFCNSGVQGAGFDKVLQYGIVRKNLRIAFADKAIVWDEKTARTDQLVKQRARWINTWFKYAGYSWKLIFFSFSNASINQFLFGLVLMRPPLFIFLGLGSLCFVVNMLTQNWWIACSFVLGFLLFVSAFLLALKEGNANRRIYKALKGVPNFIFYQLKALLLARRANKVSVATKHDYHQQQE